MQIRGDGFSSHNKRGRARGQSWSSKREAGQSLGARVVGSS